MKGVFAFGGLRPPSGWKHSSAKRSIAEVADHDASQPRPIRPSSSALRRSATMPLARFNSQSGVDDVDVKPNDDVEHSLEVDEHLRAMNDTELELERERIMSVVDWHERNVVILKSDVERLAKEESRRQTEDSNRWKAHLRTLSRCPVPGCEFLEFPGDETREVGHFGGFCCQRCRDQSAPETCPYGGFFARIHHRTLEHVPP